MKYYYEVSFLKSPLNPLTYECDEKIAIGSKVFVKLGNRKKLSDAVIIKEVEKPKFKCVKIDEISTTISNASLYKIYVTIHEISTKT